MIDLNHTALLTDLYELTMAAAYFENNFQHSATFEMFVRQLPPNRSFLLSAGLEQALDYLESFRFRPEEIDFLRKHPVFQHISDSFFDFLRELRFTGEVWAIPEGTPVFANEPILRVTAPIIEGQIVETHLMTALTFQTTIATKAARIVEAAQGRGVVEFGTRRAHGPEAGVLAARAAYIGGCRGTSNVEAGFRFGIPTFGTLAHSFVMAYGDEGLAFKDFMRLFGDKAVLLVDTYDTLSAIEKIIDLGLHPRAVRLDSGNLIELSNRVRERLDAGGLSATKIFVSGDLDETAIYEALAAKAPMDYFGVGTELAVSKDAPTLSTVYKLVEIDSGAEPHYRAKFSEEKVTYPGRKQVYRLHDSEGCLCGDVVARADESREGEPLLECVMQGGRRIPPSPGLNEIRERAAQKLEHLPRRYRQLRNASAYPVRFSQKLQALMEEVRGKLMPSISE